MQVSAFARAGGPSWAGGRDGQGMGVGLGVAWGAGRRPVGGKVSESCP